MMRLLFIAVAVSFLLCGCISQTTVSGSEHASFNALSETATSINQSLTDLKQTEQAAHPPKTVREPPIPASYGMAIPVAVDWSGPVEPLVRKLAVVTNYKVRVLGRSPAIPILVSIATKHEEVGNVLRDAGYQCGKRAAVVVFPSTRVVELRYAEL